MKISDTTYSLIWLRNVCGFINSKMLKLCEIASPNNLRLYLQKYILGIESKFGIETSSIMSDTYKDDILLNKEIAELEKNKIGVLGIDDLDYPEALKNIEQPPLLLFYKGDISLLKTRCLAVVGSRNASRYGLDITSSFVSTITKLGVTIVSGLARGIDTASHKAALDADGKTIAVVGSGLDIVYPPENQSIAENIVEKGLIISEYPIGTPPNNYQFPERNRIISGLSEGVLVTEAGLKSGSLITADEALNQGKHLFVVPQALNNKRGEGCNQLIQKCQGAITLSPDDIAEAMGFQRYIAPVSDMQLDFTEEQLVEALRFSELNFEELLSITQIGVSELNSMLTKLELLGIIKKLENNYYGV